MHYVAHFACTAVGTVAQVVEDVKGCETVGCGIKAKLFGCSTWAGATLSDSPHIDPLMGDLHTALLR
jgi:hypothetical protein